MKKYILPILSTFLVVLGVSAMTFTGTPQELKEFLNKGDGMLGATITDVVGTDVQSDFVALYNTNNANLNTDKLENSDLSGGTGITYTAGAITFDCSEVIGTGMTCATEAITLNATGDWTGTFDGAEGSAYLSVATYLASTTNSAFTSIPSLVTVGTIGTGVWQGTAIVDAYVNNTQTISLQENSTMPTGASTTVDATGEWVLNTSNQIIAYGTSSSFVVDEDGKHSFCYNTASSTPGFVSGDFDEIASLDYPITVYKQSCKVKTGMGTTQDVNLSDSGTNDMDTVTCATTRAYADVSTNNTLTATEDFRLEYGTNTGTTTDISFCAYYRITAN